MDLDLRRKGTGTLVEGEEEEHHKIRELDFLAAEEITLEEDQEEVEAGYHWFEGTVEEVEVEVESGRLDPEKMIEGEEELMEEKVKYVMMKQRLMEAVVVEEEM
jgi:hypothetical protein